jgi:hypothetical protein
VGLLLKRTTTRIGNVVVVRYADDLVVGFQYVTDAPIATGVSVGQPRRIPVKAAPSFQGTSKTAILCYNSSVLLSDSSPVNSSILGAPRLNVNLGTL